MTRTAEAPGTRMIVTITIAHATFGACFVSVLVRAQLASFDRALEDAFQALSDGVTIRVGEGAETAARFRLEGMKEVRKFLDFLDELLHRRAEDVPVSPVLATRV